LRAASRRSSRVRASASARSPLASLVSTRV